MAEKNIKANVEFQAKGLKALRGQWLDFAGDLAEPMILLAAGATKAQALWGGLRGVFMTRVLGPMGLVSGAAVALLAVTGKLVSKWKEVGMAGAGALSRMTLEFKPLLGSVELAKQRVKELYDFTARTPFRLEGVVKANKTLETLTKGALSNERGMKLVGDSAAVAGVEFNETARSVGRLYNGLMSGRPVGEASMRLQEMGLISGKTRNALEAMQKTGVSGIAIWKMVEAELANNKGAMKDLSLELEGLQSTLEDTKDLAKTGFSKGFMKGEKAVVKATTAAWAKLTPVIEYAGRQFGTLGNWMDKGKAKMMNMVTSLPGLESGLKLVANAFLVLNAAVVLATGAALGRFLVNVVLTTAAQKRQIVTMGADAVAMHVNASVTRKLTIAKMQLIGALSAVRSGALATAVSHLKMSAAATVAAFKTGGLAAATGVLSGALSVVGKAMGFVIVQIRAMAVAIATNPIMLAMTVFLALGAVLLHLANKWGDATKALEDYVQASDDVISSLEAQRKGIETVIDLRKHEAQVLSKLGDAYREEAEARRAGNQDMLVAAQNKIIALRKEVEATNVLTRARLRKNAADMDDEERAYRDGKDVKDMKRDAELQDAGADERVVILERRMREAKEKQAAAKADMAAQKDSRNDVDEVGKKDNAEIERVRQELAELEAEKKDLAGAPKLGFKSQADMDHRRERVAKNPGELIAKRKQLAEMEAASGAGAQTAKALESDSEITRLEAKLSLYKQVEAARKAVGGAEKALDGVAEGDDDESEKAKDEARRDLDKARADLSAMEGLQEKHGGFNSPREAQNAETQVKRLRSERQDDASGKNVYEAERALEKGKKDRENEIARVKIDAAAAVAALQSRGMAAEEKAIEYAREKLEMAREQVSIGKAEYESQLKIIKARGEQMREQAKERGMRLASSLAERSLRRKSEAARREGDQTRSKELREEADKVRDAQRKRELNKEAEGVTSDPAKIKQYVDAVMAEEKAARAGQRKRDESASALDRERTRAAGDGGLESSILKRQGRSGEAARLEEARQRKLDEVKRKELQKKYRDDGFSGDDADNLANRDVKVDQAQRAMDTLKAQAGSSNVVASSLAQIGGGGGVSGRDPNTKILEKMESLLTQIRDQEKVDVTGVY